MTPPVVSHIGEAVAAGGRSRRRSTSKGTDNAIKGADNDIKGTDNAIKGADNDIKGTDTAIKGADNDIKGTDAAIKGADDAVATGGKRSR